MGRPLGFAPEAALEGLSLPCEGQVWRWCSLLGCRGSGSTRYSGELAARAAGSIVLYKGMATSLGQYAPVFLPGEHPSLTEKPDRPQSTGSQRVGHDQSDPAHIKARLFCLWQLRPQRELSMKVVQLLVLQGSWWLKVWRDMVCLLPWSYGFILSLFLSLLYSIRVQSEGNQKASLASLSP